MRPHLASLAKEGDENPRKPPAVRLCNLVVREVRGVRVAGNDRNFYYAFWLP